MSKFRYPLEKESHVSSYVIIDELMQRIQDNSDRPIKLTKQQLKLIIDTFMEYLIEKITSSEKTKVNKLGVFQLIKRPFRDIWRGEGKFESVIIKFRPSSYIRKKIKQL